jgi:hypothetical protein
MDEGIERNVFYRSRDKPIKCVTLPDGKQMISLYDLVAVLLNATNPGQTIKRFLKLYPNFKIDVYQFEGERRHATPVAEGKNVVLLLMRIRMNNEMERDPQDIRSQFIDWIMAVISGDSGLMDTIEANAELAQDESTLHNALTTLFQKAKVFYQIDCSNRPVVYLRCDPTTYEVFAIEKAEILPDCPELGTCLKFGLSHNLADREDTFRENGVFVFFVALESRDDAILLENALKKNFRTQRKRGTNEYLQLETLKLRFQEEQAKGVLRRVKDTIINTIRKLMFLHTLRVSIFTARDVSQVEDGIAVVFDEEQMDVRGRQDDEDYQVLVKRVRELEEENNELKKKLRVANGTEVL